MKISSQKGFSGVDERLKLTDGLSVASEMRNFRITAGGSLTKREGFTAVCLLDSKVEGLWCGSIGNEEFIAAASGGKLYRIPPDTLSATPTLIGDIAEGECTMFEFNGLLYVKAGAYYGKYDGSTLSEVEGYIPCVALSCAPSGEGEAFEEINLLSPKRKQLFSGDGTSVYYRLAEKNIDSVVSITINGTLFTGRYSVNPITAAINFESAPAEGLNNIEVVYTKAHPESDINRIMNCTRIMLFGGNSDGRAFLWGNPDYPNYRFHSSLADGIPSVEYFPVNSFTVIGNSKINCIIQQYDRQLIFTKNDAYYSYCELRDDGLGNIVSSFPVYSLNSSKGCLFETNGCIIDNRPVTLCDDGLNMWESTSVENEKNAVCFSMPISESISGIIKGSKEDLFLFDFQANREMYFIAGGTAYVYNYGTGAWYVYDGFGGEHYSVLGNTLYYSSGRAVAAFSDAIKTESAPDCIWRSPYITSGHSSGIADVAGFEADVYIEGPITLKFTFEHGGGNTIRTFEFGSEVKRYMRISARTAIKRAMPFRLTFYENGEGVCVLHGVSIKTREKERSRRFGIL